MKKKKPSIGIIGSGNLARVLALACDRAGYHVLEVAGRNATRARSLARRVKAAATRLDASEQTADVYWICVTDDAIAEVARTLARSGRDWRGRVVVHTSGAYASDLLAPLRRKGAAVGSAHPMNSFVKTSNPDLRGVPFAVEGDIAAVRAASAVAASLGGDVFPIRAKDKVAYHAMGAFSSPLLISLLSAGEKLGRSAGLREPRKVMARILMETIRNFLENSGEGAFSGPIKRGDVTTVERHLRGVRRVPGALEIYRALGSHAVKSLPGKNKAAMRKLLAGLA